MQNYSQVFADTLNEFESLYVAGDQGDNAKGQVTARAGYTINATVNTNVGYISKSAGQTQFNGISVDAIKDKSDGTWGDYLTDELQPDGRRLILLAYTPHNEPIPAGSNPAEGWVQPTQAHLDYPGPLTLKADSGGGTDPIPPEPPPADYTEVLEALDNIDATLATMQSQQANDTAAIIANDTANAEKGMQQISDLVEDVEESLIQFAMLLLLFRRPDDGGTKASKHYEASVHEALDAMRDKSRARRDARKEARQS